jgi:hypothetical protein
VRRWTRVRCPRCARSSARGFSRGQSDKEFFWFFVFFRSGLDRLSAHKRARRGAPGSARR